jgi:hypothetical protein
MKKATAWVLTCLLLISSFTTAAAAAAAAEAPGPSVEVKMTIGNSEVIVNGEVLQVKAPVVIGNSTLVPLRVITAAFSADLQWIAETQGIVLTYGDQTIELQIDSNASTVNGETKAIPGAPKLIDSTTMVPVRFISETFGADVQFDGATQSISIKGKKNAASSNGDGTSINKDEGKTKIGDSHWGWTIAYPTGLVQDYQSFNGNDIYFMDANGEYSLEVFIDAGQPNLKESGLLSELSEYVYGSTVLDKRLVKNPGEPTYAKIVSKSSYGEGYYEDRAYLKNGILYVVSFQVMDPVNYKNASKSAVYNDLLNSFTPSFDPRDMTVKNVSRVKDGFIRHADEDYGITLDLPVGWATGYSGLNFYSVDDNFELVFTMTSLEKGQTISSWVDSHKERFTQEYLPAYREIVDLPSLRVDGTPARAVIWSSSLGGGWSDTYDVYLIKGNYKYNFSFMYDKANREMDRSTIERIVKSIDIDESVAEEMFGYLEDEYAVDMWEKERFVSDKNGYTIEVPAFWKEEGDGEDLHYVYTGGSLMITTRKDAEVSEWYNMTVSLIENYKKHDKTIAVLESTNDMFKGELAKKLVYQGDDGSGNLLQSTIYMFKKNGIVYGLEHAEYASGKTEENKKRLADAMESLTFK